MNWAYIGQKTLVFSLSKLPEWLLYSLSDVLFLVNYHIIKYRKRVVQENLKNAFPEKSLAEIKAIEREFYRYLSDQLVETLRTFTMRAVEINHRVHVLNPEVMNDLHEKGKHVVHLLGHHANWEWYAKALSLQTRHWLFFVYKPLGNASFDILIRQMREKFGIKAVPMKKVFQEVEKHQHVLHATFFGGDQSPLPHNRYVWIPFMQQQTAVYTGAEDMAKKYDMAVVFGKMRRVKRGFYTIELTLITDQAGSTAPGEITKMHTQCLQDLLHEQPAYWLWSHRRWKLNPIDHPSNVRN